jgi:predicted alpha/beta hydrolase family esterase
MTTFITLPGIGGSEESHWQTRWERSHPSMKRFNPSDWERPQLPEWCGALQQAVDAANDPIILVAHSLSCLLVAHWAAQSTSAIAGAFLAAVPDPNAPTFPSAASSFRATPPGALRFPSVIVASMDDPYGSLEYVQGCAQSWKSRLVNIGASGHINASSNLGEWPQGKSILKQFCKELGIDGGIGTEPPGTMDAN